MIQDGSFANVRELMDRQQSVDKTATEAGEDLKAEQAPVFFFLSLYGHAFRKVTLVHSNLEALLKLAD